MGIFHRGNKVRFISGLYIGREAVVEGSVQELYGHSNTDIYNVFLLKSGDLIGNVFEEQLELIDVGGEHLLNEARELHKELNDKTIQLKKYLVCWESGKRKYAGCDIHIVRGSYIKEAYNVDEVMADFKAKGNFAVHYASEGDFVSITDIKELK